MGKQTLPDAARQGQSLHQARIQRKKCTSKEPCGDWYPVDGKGNRIERAPAQSLDPLSIMESAYAAMHQFTSRWNISADGYPALSHRFLATVDEEPSPQTIRAFTTAFPRFITAYPILAVFAVESMEAGRSGRDLAEELGLSHPTVATILFRARELLGGMLREELAATA